MLHHKQVEWLQNALFYCVFLKIFKLYQKSIKISKDQWTFLKVNEKSIKISKNQWTILKINEKCIEISKDQWTVLISLYKKCLWLQRGWRFESQIWWPSLKLMKKRGGLRWRKRTKRSQRGKQAQSENVT